MATDRVWGGFFHTWTRPVGQDPQPVYQTGFFPGAQTLPVGPRLAQPNLGPIRGPNHGPTRKKKNAKRLTKPLSDTLA